MNKRLFRIIGGTIFLLILIFIMTLVSDNQLHKQEDLRLPSRISSYSDAGYYKIDPETILTSLGDGDEDVFTEDPSLLRSTSPLERCGFLRLQKAN